MSGRLRCRPAPTGRPPPTHTERRREIIGVFTARGSSAQPSSSHTPPPATASTTSRRGCQGKREGNLTWRTTSSLAPERRRRGKKGADTAAGTDGRDILHACSCRACRGTPRCSPRSTRLGWQATCTSVEGGRYSNPSPSSGSPQAQAYLPHQLPRLKQPREWCSRDLQWSRGSPHPHVLASPAAWAQLTASSPADSGQQNAPQSQSSSTLRKPFELARPHAILANPREEGDPGENCSPARGLPPAPSGQSQVPGPQITLQGTGDGTPQGGISNPFLFNLLMEKLVALPFQAGTVLLSYADNWGPRCHRAGVTGFARRSALSTSSPPSARSWASRFRRRSPGP
ncbi:hypothetical protein GWK47_016298 [Chionoecetes opilio]|uniref:Uncharacterized protein n=1 Tax=Chionoecetes opilio TaxID=41210 RepID=A0A8J5BZ71_CHIOP|nr:hypothetical protein GWK47_016298 [Chionoecetes opilio]